MLLDALLVILSGVACFGVAAIELHEPARRTTGADRPLESLRPAGALPAGVVAALLAVLAWWVAGRLPGNAATLGAAAALLLYGLWRLTGGILGSGAPAPLRAEPAPGGQVAAGPVEAGRKAWIGGDPGPGRPFLRPLVRWLAVCLVAVTAGMSTGQPAAAALGALAAIVAFGALNAGPLSTLLERSPAGLPTLLVALLVVALGTLWAGAAVGIAWPGGGVAILALLVGYLIVAVGALEVSRQWLRAVRPLPPDPDGISERRAERSLDNDPVGVLEARPERSLDNDPVAER